MTKTQRALACAALIAAGLLVGCGGRQSVASKSAAAYQEAVRNGRPVTGGHEHGGHAPEPEGTASHDAMADMDHEPMQATKDSADHSTMRTDSMAGMDHSAMKNSSSMPGMDHSKMTGGSMPEMDHSKMQSGSMANMDHSKMDGAAMPRMDHSTMSSGSMAGMDQSTMTSGSMAGMDHSTMSGAAQPMAGMDHSAAGSSSMVGMGHSTTHGATQNGSATVSTATPSQTLSMDAFDAPASTSLHEAAKASGTTTQGDHGDGGHV